MASGAREAAMIVKTVPTSPSLGDIIRGKSRKIKLFKKPVGRIAKSSSINHTFMQSFRSSQRHFTWGSRLALLLFITDWNTASLFERSLTGAKSYISSHLIKSRNLIIKKDFLLTLSIGNTNCIFQILNLSLKHGLLLSLSIIKHYY